MPFIFGEDRDLFQLEGLETFHKDKAPELDFEGACGKNGADKSSENQNISKPSLALAFGALDVLRVLIYQNFQSLLKSSSQSKMRVETKANKKD